MGSRTLREAVDAADAERFVGRAAELAVVRGVLAAATASRVLFVHGPGGIGKSALLRAVGRAAAAEGFDVVRIDARGLPTEPERAADAIAGHGGGTPCIVVDEVDALGSSLDALRDLLLDRLPDSARLVLAGRKGPGPSWREDGLDAIVVALALRPLPDVDAAVLLARGSVSSERIPEIVAWAQGSPLALTVAASVPAGHPEGQGAAGIEQRLTSWLAGQPILDVPQDVLEVAAIARSVDARLLAAALPGRNTREGLAMLAALPVAERFGDVVALHAVLAAAIRARLRASEPRRAAELVRRIAEHLATRARLGDMGALLRLSQLIESPALRAAIGNEPSDTYYADGVRDGEVAEFGRRHGFAAGPDWDEVAAWIEDRLDHTLVLRRVEGQAVMVACFVPAGLATATGAVTASLLHAAGLTGADPDRSFVGVVLFADAPAHDVAESARLGTGAFMLQRGVGDVHTMLIHYPPPDRRPSMTATIATEVPGATPRPVALSDFRPAGAVGFVEALVLGEQGFAPRGDDRSGLLAQDDDPDRIARLKVVLDEVFGEDRTEQQLRRAIELVHLGSRPSEQECLDTLHLSRRSWYRLLRTARERLIASA